MSVRGDKSFWRNSQGNLTITTSVVGLMLATAVGAALDGSRLFTTHQSLQSITDAAALAAAMPERATTAKRIEIAKATIQKHADQLKRFEKISDGIEVKGSGEQVYVSLSAEVPMLFAGVLGAESRRVSASSLAEETSSSSKSDVSVSVVLDLSSSMSGKFDTGSKLAGVNAALADLFKSLEAGFGGEIAASTRLSTGVYPFNWGSVESDTVSLQPGIDTVAQVMSYMALSDGSVPTTAMEQAVQDQIDEANELGARDRFIVYVTDGKVDEDKADADGRHLRMRDMFRAPKSKMCRKMAARLLQLDEEYNPDTMDTPGNGSELSKIKKSATPVRNLENNLLGRGNGQGKAVGLQRQREQRASLRDEYISQCQPEQTLRVAEACEKARENGISMIAVNLSGEDGTATNTTDMCVNGFTLSEMIDPKKPPTKKADELVPTDDGDRTKTLPSGLKVHLSADGKSFRGDVSSLEELREILATMVPEGTHQRSVRLVN